jgi:hypothetical protein
MRRIILAIGLACLLSFTSVTAPVTAADLTMPVKAPPPPPPAEVVEFCWPCVLLAAGAIACIALCFRHDEDRFVPVSPGAPAHI